GTVLIKLDCGGLYTGGGGETVPLPSVVPDQGSSLTKVQACQVGGNFTLAATVPADVGGTNPHRSCTSAGVAGPHYPAGVVGTQPTPRWGWGPADSCPCVPNADCRGGTCPGSMSACLFGPPLPIPNASFVGSSVCVINRVSASATGSGNCNAGSTTLD